MQSIERRFISMQEKYPNHSSFICFGRAIKDQGFSESMIKRWFNKLVDKDDYCRSEKAELFAHLYSL